MIRPGADDLLTQMTAEALVGCMAEARRNGRIWPRIIYANKRGRVKSFCHRFDDFLAVALGAHRRFDAQQGLLMTMGFEFYCTAVTFAEMHGAQPRALEAERENWDRSTVYVMLKSCAPRFVIIVDYIEVGSASMPGPVGSPSIIAIGLHPGGIVGFAATYHPAHRRGIAFGPMVALKAGAAQAHGLKNYLTVFGPGAN